MLDHGWPIWMIKMSSMRFYFRVLSRLEGGFEMTWKKDHAKFKMAAILLQQSLFLFLSWFLIATGSSLCARIGPRAPPLLSTSGTILIRELL